MVNIMEKRYCKFCKKELISNAHNRKYCNNKCRNKFNYQKNKQLDVSRIKLEALDNRYKKDIMGQIKNYKNLISYYELQIEKLKSMVDRLENRLENIKFEVKEV